MIVQTKVVFKHKSTHTLAHRQALEAMELTGITLACDVGLFMFGKAAITRTVAGISAQQAQQQQLRKRTDIFHLSLLVWLRGVFEAAGLSQLL